MYRAMDGPSVSLSSLPSGDTGIKKTVANMQAMTEQAAHDPRVRSAVILALNMKGIASHHLPAQTEAWFEYIRDQIRFINDPVGVEWLQAPWYTLAVGAGDCDDRAMLLAAGLRSMGIPARFKIVAADPRRPQSFSHVYVVANVAGREVSLDPTYPDNVMGDEPPQQYRVLFARA